MMVTEVQQTTLFVEFDLRDGKFIGIDVRDDEYEIKEIVRYGNGDTVVTYYDHYGNEVETLHSKGNYHEYREF